MIEWSESHEMIRDAVRRFIDEELVPHVEELEHGDLPPYDILRKMYATFGMGEMARARFERQIEKAEGGPMPARSPKKDGVHAPGRRHRSDGAAMAADPDRGAVQVLPRHGHGHGRVSRADRRPRSWARARSSRRSAGGSTF